MSTPASRSRCHNTAWVEVTTGLPIRASSASMIGCERKLRQATIEPVGLRVPGAERQVEDRFGLGLGEAEPVGDAEMRAGNRLDAARGEEAMLGCVDGLGVRRNRRHALQGERAAGGEDAVGRGRRRRPGDMPDLAAQALVEGMTLDDARCGAAISDRMRPAAGDLTDRAHAVLAVHLDDLLRRGSLGDQHAGKMHADCGRHDPRVPFFDHDIDARHDDPEPDSAGHSVPSEAPTNTRDCDRPSPARPRVRGSRYSHILSQLALAYTVTPAKATGTDCSTRPLPRKGDKLGQVGTVSEVDKAGRGRQASGSPMRHGPRSRWTRSRRRLRAAASYSTVFAVFTGNYQRRPLLRRRNPRPPAA